jgi:hypothetical protein
MATLFAVGLSLVSCSSSEPPAPGDDATALDARSGIPARAADISGTLTSVTPSSGDMLSRVRIEEKPDQPSGDNKALVRVTARTRILKRVGSAVRRAAVADLRAGARVDAWFTGPVAESYPVQAEGAVLVVR